METEDNTSEFSYTQSDANFNKSREETQLEENPKEYSGSDASNDPFKDQVNEKFQGFQPPLPPSAAISTSSHENLDSPITGRGAYDRKSYMSGLSQYSEANKEIAQQVSIKAINQQNEPSVKLSNTHDRSKSITEETNSVISSDSIQMGKLNTTSNRVTNEPNLSYQTNIEGAIPPRSSRRPKSEIVISNNDLKKDIDKFKKRRNSGIPKTKRHSKRLSISDDLDRLMESANSMKNFEDDDYYREGGSSKNELPQPDSENDKTITEENDKQLPEENKRLAEDHQQSTQDDRQLPEEDKHQFPLKEIMNKNEHELGHQRTGSEISTDTYETAEGLKSQEMVNEFKPSLPPRPSVEKVKRAQRLSSQIQEQEKLSRKTSLESTDKTQSLDESSTPKQTAEKEEPKELKNTKNYGSLNHDQDTSRIKLPKRQNSTRLASSGIIIDDDDDDEKFSIKEQGQFNPTEPLSELLKEVQEDEFSDIEEPVLVNKPLKGKLVRESTTRSKQKSKPKRAKLKKLKHNKKELINSVNSLKPFSYNTLINLLESINGTVIGEEFNQLNLPIKEKQLIEKIIDSLSRLTSDMIIDENRYEVGIQRLEKALRVLEGFM